MRPWSRSFGNRDSCHDGSRHGRPDASGGSSGRSILTLGATRQGVSKDTTDMADFFRGGLDDVCIYNHAFSDDQSTP